MTTPQPHRRRFSPLAAALLLLAAAPAAPAQPPSPPAGDDLLVADRWRESAFGISLRPPRGAEVTEHTTEGALVRFALSNQGTINVFIRQNPDAELNLKVLKDQTRVEVSYGSRQALEVADVEVRPGGRPGFLTYFDVERDRNVFDKGAADHWIFGQALMKIDPHTVAVFQLQCPVAAFEESRRVFEAMIGSIEVASPDELDRVRRAWIKAGQRWFEGVDQDALLSAMRSEQWFRVVEGDKDVGYQRVRHALGEEMGLPGLRVDVASRIVSGDEAFDTESFFFVSEDRTTEVWSVRTARRSLRQQGKAQAAPLLGNAGRAGAPAAQGPAPELYEETGLRSGDSITVKRTLPGQIKDLTWRMPREGYLSQALLHVLPPLFPRDQQRDLAFYACNTATGELTLRSFAIFPLDEGRFVVRERPSPAESEQVTTYDPAGRLLRREFADGRVHLPSTPEEMRRIWGVK